MRLGTGSREHAVTPRMRCVPRSTKLGVTSAVLRMAALQRSLIASLKVRAPLTFQRNLCLGHRQSVISLGYSTSEDEDTQLNGASPPQPPDDERGIPHRWRVVIMMAAAFVLCNMDKVGLERLHEFIVLVRASRFHQQRALSATQHLMTTLSLSGGSMQVNMSVAVIPMAEELGWSATDRGIVNSAFFWGYSITQIPAGWVSTKCAAALLPSERARGDRVLHLTSIPCVFVVQPHCCVYSWLSSTINTCDHRLGGARVLSAGVGLWSLGTLFAPPAAKASLLALCASRVFVGLGEGLAPSSATGIMAKIVPECAPTSAPPLPMNSEVDDQQTGRLRRP